jgi:hypothetical protein
LNNRSIGAYANVFDISHIYPSPVFYGISNLAYEDWVNYDGDNPYDTNFVQQITDTYGAKPIGQHYYKTGDTNGFTLVWDFSVLYGTTAVADAEVVGDLPSPDSDPGSVDWLQLTVTSGSLAQDVLLIYTDGGEPPEQVKNSPICNVQCATKCGVFVLVYAWIRSDFGQIHRTVL